MMDDNTNLESIRKEICRRIRRTMQEMGCDKDMANYLISDINEYFYEHLMEDLP